MKMPKRVNLLGQRFGRLTVIDSGGKHENGAYQWKCRCDCGTVKVIIGSALTTKGTKSCGCYQLELRRAYTKRYSNASYSEYMARKRHKNALGDEDVVP
jgi:hypothetical protein